MKLKNVLTAAVAALTLAAAPALAEGKVRQQDKTIYYRVNDSATGEMITVCPNVGKVYNARVGLVSHDTGMILKGRVMAMRTVDAKTQARINACNEGALLEWAAQGDALAGAIIDALAVAGAGRLGRSDGAVAISSSNSWASSSASAAVNKK